MIACSFHGSFLFEIDNKKYDTVQRASACRIYFPLDTHWKDGGWIKIINFEKKSLHNLVDAENGQIGFVKIEILLSELSTSNWTQY